MTVSYFVLFEGHPANGVEPFARAFFNRYEGILRRLPGVGSILVYTPEAYHDPMLQDDPGPALLVRVTFPTLDRLESSLRSKTAVLDFAKFVAFTGFRGRARDEIMHDTQYPVADDPAGKAPSGPLSYYVFYQGPAQDRRAFIGYYEKNHPPLLGLLPGIRTTVLYTPTDRGPPLEIAHAGHILICDVSFASSDALNAALDSQVRKDLRDDYHKFPKFEGPVVHQAMKKLVIKA